MSEMFVSENAKANTVSSVNQVTSNVSITTTEGAKLKVLFVGNSITRHGIAPHIGWHGDWGMAASALEKDYVHQVVSDIEKKVGAIDYCIAQLSLWENKYFDGSKVLEENYACVRDFAADLVIIRIGENINRDKNKEINCKPYFDEMIKFVSEKNPNAQIIVTDNFWQIEVLNKIFKEVAEENGYTFCRIGDLEQDEKTMALGEFEHDGVARHPSDYGMRCIADRIVEKINFSIYE